MPRWLLFRRLILRPMLRERGRSLLVLFAVALGVSVVLAIDLAGNAAAGSFHSSMETLAGDNDFEITAAGGVPDAFVGKLDQLPYPLRVTPRIEDHATVIATGATVPLIGIDFIAQASRQPVHRPAAPDRIGGIAHFSDPHAVWVTHGLAQGAGQKIRLLVNDRARDYIVQGFIPETAHVSGEAVLMDIAAAQLATGRSGRVDRILVKVPSQPGIDYWQQKLRAALPAGLELRPQGSQTAANRRMLSAFRWNLRVLSYIALLVGAFLIYNTISVSVVRRRSDIGTLRALGATRSAVLGAFLAEAVIFGLVGAAVALPLGRFLATGAVRLIATTVNSLYVTSHPGDLSLTAASVILALVVGVGTALASAFPPAREASLVPPTEAMARGRREYTIRVQRKRDALLAVLLALAAALASRAPAIGGKPLFGYLAALLLVGASALAIPALISWLTAVSSGLLCRIFGVEALLASRSLAGSLRRTSVLVGTLSTAIAMMTSVGIMVGSFRQTVIAWMQSELPADLYLRPAGTPGGDRYPTIAPGLADRIAQLAGVAAVGRFRAYAIDYQGLPVTLASIDTNAPRRPGTSEFLSGRPPAVVFHHLDSGDVALVSEPFANKHHIRAGDNLILPLGQHRVTFHVIDVFFDYGNEAGYIMLARRTMLRYLPDPAVSSIAVYLAPGANLERVRQEVTQACAGHDVLVLSDREIRTRAIHTFDQTFAITYALEAVAVLVAVLGIAGALISIVIDRRRELGVLRFLGAASSQIRHLILAEAGLLGLFAILAGLPLGYLLSLLLIYVINRQSFGWTIQFHWPVAVLVTALTVVYAATILAGFYPARMAQRLNPIEVIHEE